MTRDTDEHEDPYKIDISLNNDEDNKRKRFFEKGLNALLTDPYFLLLYVPDNGAKMQIIRPATNLYHRKRMIKMINEARRVPSFYYALSHLWGISENNRHHWNDISEYVYDDEGKPVKPVSMRPEKRDALLQLLKDHPDSYWWIDVLCARTDTPLDIMGDVYACCIECIAMIDCEASLIPKLHTKMGAKEDFADFWFNENRSPNEVLQFKQLNEEYPQLIDDLGTFFQSQWWQRVWTWQEMALPSEEVRFMSEGDIHRGSKNTIILKDLLNSCMNATRVMYYLFEEYDPGRESKEERNLLRWFFDINQARTFNEHHTIEKKAEKFMLLILSFSQSTRHCMDPVDYVYGLLGIFQVKIPRLSDPNEVWNIFLSEIDKYMEDIKNVEFPLVDSETARITGVTDRACQVDLRNAKNMADVYDDFLELV
ncbi:hypothetical protein O0I10_011770 [Lichtheimia ornata]|uniref:Heterokaryon incompatibility domain-containing protein n=1 Tax=Lichtheimia ornata TaxID=688661 RepID=A0AAD7XS88_9FUNG|nr:uncharacterized protein O0I10_011770 [Lichtheimia ornata]KAJ8652565.1 hypothetical protein O0I10_011770 [Lichtheimia ornata]